MCVILLAHDDVRQGSYLCARNCRVNFRFRRVQFETNWPRDVTNSPRDVTNSSSTGVVSSRLVANTISHLLNVLYNTRMFAFGLKSAGCNGLVFFGNMLNNVLHHDSGRSPATKTLFYKVSNVLKNSSGACLSNSAVKPSSSPHFRVFSRWTAKRSSDKSHPGSVKRMGLCSGWHGPTNNASNIDAKSSRCGYITLRRPEGRGK